MLFPGTSSKLLPRTILVRPFYHRLATRLLSQDWAILIGNPGTSKSWYQWYLLYSITNKNLELGNYTLPKVVVRQVGTSQMTYYFPQADQAYTVYRCDPTLLSRLNPSDTLYLYEPGESLVQPYYTVFCGRIIATCSPNETRYKEFAKNGARKFYMPVWELEELQLVGEYIRTECQSKDLKVDFSAGAIEHRYRRFGGIFRYVLPDNRSMLIQAENKQTAVLSHSKVTDVFAPYRSIEKTDSQKENISHFILQYDVEHGKDQSGEEEDFTNFRMQLASDYVRANLDRVMNEHDLVESIHFLKRMFNGGIQRNSDLFQSIIYQVLPIPQGFDWKVFESGKWSDHQWGLTGRERVEKNCENVKNMKPGILYYPVDPFFPGADFVFKKFDKEVCCIQVTFGENHRKPETAYRFLYTRLGLDPDKHEITCYLITSPVNEEKYAKNTLGKLVNNHKDFSLKLIHFQVVKCNWKNDKMFVDFK